MNGTVGLPEATIGMGANVGSVVLPERIPMGVAMEMLLTGEYVTSEDRKEGIAAYLEKRKPPWSGR